MLFIESRAFSRRFSAITGDSWDEVLCGIQEELLQSPERGSMVRGLGGIRKARCGSAKRRKGKRGGYRYLYLYLKHKEHTHLLFFLDKGEQEDLTNTQRAILRELVAEIKRA